METIRKSLMLVTLFTLMSCSVFYSKDLKEFNLRGEVNSVKSVKFQALEKFGEVVRGKKRSRNELDNLDMSHSNISVLFDDKGNLEWITYFNMRGRVEFKVTLKDTILNYYHSDGSLMMKSIGNDINYPTEFCNYDSEGKLEYKIFMNYDKNKKIIKEKEYSSDGSLIRVSNFTYNKRGFISKEEKLEIKEKYSYYSRGLDTIKSTLLYTYNDYNDVVTYVVKKNGEKEEKTYTYKYDKNDNWIQRIEYRGLQPKYLIEREIEYKQ